MENQIEVYDKCNDMNSIQLLGDAIATSGMFGCENKSQGMVLAVQCLAERKPPLEMAKTYHLIKGKLSKRADAMLAEFRKAGGKWVWGDLKDREKQTATVEFEGVTREVEYTIQDAKDSGVWNAKPESNWRKFPGPMMRARLTSETLRAIAPEIVQGAYTPEEIEAPGDERVPLPVHKVEVVQPATVATKTPHPDDEFDHPRDRLRPFLEPHADKVNAFMQANGRVKAPITWEYASEAYLERVAGDIEGFLKAAGVEV